MKAILHRIMGGTPVEILVPDVARPEVLLVEHPPAVIGAPPVFQAFVFSYSIKGRDAGVAPEFHFDEKSCVHIIAEKPGPRLVKPS